MQVGDLVKYKGWQREWQEWTGIIIYGPYYRGEPMAHPGLFGPSNQFYTVLWGNGDKAEIRKSGVEVISKCK